jgi:predicted HicB family RNase H-like nuclease
MIYTWKLSGTNVLKPNGRSWERWHKTRHRAYQAVKLSVASKLNAWLREGWLTRSQVEAERQRTREILKSYAVEGDFEISIEADRPTDKLVPCQVNLPDGVRVRVQEIAEAQGTSLSQWVRELVEAAI